MPSSSVTQNWLAKAYMSKLLRLLMSDMQDTLARRPRMSLAHRAERNLNLLATYRRIEPAQIVLTLRRQRVLLEKRLNDAETALDQSALSGALCRVLELSMRACLMPNPPKARTEPDGRIARPVLEMLEPEPAPEPAPEPQS